MEKKTASRFFTLYFNRPDLSPDQRDLYRTLYATLSYIPPLLLFIALGFGIIYLLGQTGLLDKNEPSLLIVAGLATTAALLHLPLYPLIRKGNLNLVTVFLILINGLLALAQVFVWQGIIWLPISAVASITLFFATQQGLQRAYRWGSLIFGLVCVIGIYFAESTLPLIYARMKVGDSLTQMAALSIFIMVFIAMMVLVLLNSRVNFHTISGRFVTIFTFVALLSSLATLIIAALANLYYDRQKIYDELNAVSAVRTKEVEVALDNLERDTNRTLTDPLIDQRINYLLTNKPENLTYQINYELVRAYLIKQQTSNSRYQEILLLDGTGKAIISTSEANKDRDFAGFHFFQNALMGINYDVEYNFPASFDQSSILLVRPIILNGFLRGAISTRANFDAIKQILVANTGIGKTAETYLVGLVDGKLTPLTNTRQNIATLKTTPADEALLSRGDKGFGIWDNYSGKSVLGSYIRIPALNAVVIAEIEQQEVTQKTINISLTTAIIGVFTLLLAFAMVLITSRSISLPIVDLAEKATSLANGELATRMQVDRPDEIGTLASSFNSMAGELQTLVKTLEQKVDDRTQELQKQANYLRVSAEIARDATTARSLDELLNRAAQLVLDRFGFYHTGIFLLDKNKEYAILRASPTEAGLEMLSRNHKLKVGQVGIVGRVAASGVSRISLDTGQDAAFFNNPLLPKTRSEMALPLKVSDEMIGVLDVQSDEPKAFTQDDIGILQIMADQLALAIQRLRLSLEQQENLSQLETTYQRFTMTSWNKFSEDGNFTPGYSFDGMRMLPLTNFPLESRDSLAKGRSIILPAQNKKDATGSALAVPLKLRDRVIGVLTFQFNTEVITSETISLVEETAGRLAIALENARLYTETQKTAEQERAISEISNQLTATVNIETILRTTVREIGRILPDAEIAVRLSQENK